MSWGREHEVEAARHFLYDLGDEDVVEVLSRARGVLPQTPREIADAWVVLHLDRVYRQLRPESRHAHERAIHDDLKVFTHSPKYLVPGRVVFAKGHRYCVVLKYYVSAEGLCGWRSSDLCS